MTESTPLLTGTDEIRSLIPKSFIIELGKKDRKELRWQNNFGAFYIDWC